MSQALFNALLELGDDHLILGHRVSEWCGHAPLLEEDLAMPNMALDNIGASRNIYTYAGEVEGKGRDEDQLAYLRLDREYKNCLLVERPNEDFAHTMLKQLYFAAFMEPYWQAALSSTDETIRGIAGKAVKEMAYHIRHAGEWVIRLGDGTDESAKRMQAAVEEMTPYVEELFTMSADAKACAEKGILPDREALRAQWSQTISNIFDQALLDLPEVKFPQLGGRTGHHGEEMGFLLAQLQYVQRAYPGMSW
ncbi:1,2-phenylacetyl-CoA epoxidase subunit PaaC [Maritalea porphyrae]|jgi:ring-1,2-phenylacetyl-CoA epoxidase subunit PaaC|uniref:1,2-phenylacetyl-CoA epoxidase subunit PaaC n=1 Tax=Maritalea porphyrae TaxID=880732 RepID=UPI0022AE9134|nr:1,2-phenylacetyl-CoA epoxidase subunit PaaC [Maritalea porphyrae]MCZ4271794.1 phenylacetate-CoA oxygenase subunit PaaC [Maritalea porphyrae]